MERFIQQTDKMNSFIHRDIQEKAFKKCKLMTVSIALAFYSQTNINERINAKQ